jgi:hypothetical protein
MPLETLFWRLADDGVSASFLGEAVASSVGIAFVDESGTLVSESLRLRAGCEEVEDGSSPSGRALAVSVSARAFFLPFLFLFGAELVGTAWLEVVCDMDGACVDAGSLCESGTRTLREAFADLSANFFSGETGQALGVVSPSVKAWRSGRE